MYRTPNSTALASIAAGVMVFGFAAPIDAGQFKTLNTEGLGLGGSVLVTSSPKNTGQSMEMEVFEFRTAPVANVYSCRILANATGRTLNIRLIGVNGLPLSSCSAPPGSTCSTAPQSLLANQKFHIQVATANNAYTYEAIAILRAAVARESEAPIGYMQLAMAYGRKGDYAQADLASAQAAYLRGDNKTARDLASRAKTRFAIGTPGWVKADDIVSAKPLPGQKSN